MGPGIEQPDQYGEGDLTYNEYLRVTQLLDLQHPESDPPHHDEMLFIVIHQAYELWFKLILHEISSAMASMEAGEVLRARHFTHRIVAVMKLLTDQIHLLETMEPVEFLQFRGRLQPASGFQSTQFREIEFLCGLKDEAYLRFFDEAATKRLQDRLDGPDLRSAYYGMLTQLGYEVPEDTSLGHLENDEDEQLELIQALKQLYEQPDRDLPLYLLTESLLELDEQLALWREHHVRVVERIIGRRRGTGGSSGVDYLRTTTGKRAFPYLWEVRGYLEG